MGRKTIIECDHCGKECTDPDTHTKFIVVTGEAKKIIAEQTHTELVQTTNVYLCGSCIGRLMNRLIKTKFIKNNPNDMELMTILLSFGVIVE